MIAYVYPTTIPGLYDVVVSDGDEFRDLTVGQLNGLARSRGWELQPGDA